LANFLLFVFAQEFCTIILHALLQ